ncbi:SGNH/GDSL hydrolase family protein [Sorangium sp. So ce448]|uniref:SGNH/GDSL hydrolase family protein n=1 Tax=Sorangium sp. So ce448 TaxID=3133314 RepID=UPI003F5D9E11
MARMKFVAFGDSVVWGQGLRPEQKFVYKAARGIAAIEGVEFQGSDLTNRAHSGASIDTSQEFREEFSRVWAYLWDNEAGRQKFRQGGILPTGTLPQELSARFPTVLEQMREYAPGPDRSVDVVFVDGGGNDLNFTRYLHPESTQAADLEEAEQILRDRYRRLLGEALMRFPNATVVATGYYPLLSPDTDMERMKRLFYFFKDVAGWQQSVNDALYSDAQPAVLAALGVLGVLLVPYLIYKQAMGESTPKFQDVEAMVRYSKGRVWQIYQFASTIMREEVLDARSARLLFCEPFIGRENALFGPAPKVFESYDPDNMADPVAQERRRLADVEYQKIVRHFGFPGAVPPYSVTDPWFTGVYDHFQDTLDTWRQMSFLHPNEAGADAYVESILHAYRLRRSGSLRGTILSRGGSLRRENHIEKSSAMSIATWRTLSKIDFARVRITGTLNLFRYMEGAFDLKLRLLLKHPKGERGPLDLPIRTDAGAYYSDATGRKFYDEKDFPRNSTLTRNYILLIDKLRESGGDTLFYSDLSAVELCGTVVPGAQPTYLPEKFGSRPAAEMNRMFERLEISIDGGWNVADVWSGVWEPSDGKVALRFPVT